MNGTLTKSGKVHRVSNDTARCGVGKKRKRRQWQMDLGDVTCLRCAKFIKADSTRHRDE
jgi:hypothetical protein